PAGSGAWLCRRARGPGGAPPTGAPRAATRPCARGAAATSRGRKRRGVGRAAGQAQPDGRASVRDLDRGPVLQADETIAALRDGSVVRVVERPDRLEVRRVVALRVVRAAPEHV